MAEARRAAFVVRELKRLADSAARHSFFQLLVLLERLMPESQPLGEIGPPEKEYIRLRSSLGLAHPASDIAKMNYDAEKGHAELDVAFLGLLGVDSPLPLSVVEKVAFQSHYEVDEGRLRELFMVFEQRTYSLLYRAWRKARPLRIGKNDDRLQDRLLAAVGYSSRLGIGGPTAPSLREVRLRVLRARTVAGAEAMFRHALGYRVKVAQFKLRRTPVPLHQRSLIGKNNATVGSTLLAGARVPDRNKVCLEVQAKSLAHWNQLLPGRVERSKLDRAFDSYLRDPIDYDVAVTLAKEEIPAWELGDKSLRLGHTLWLGERREDFTRTWRGRRQ